MASRLTCDLTVGRTGIKIETPTFFCPGHVSDISPSMFFFFSIGLSAGCILSPLQFIHSGYCALIPKMVLPLALTSSLTFPISAGLEQWFHLHCQLAVILVSGSSICTSTAAWQLVQKGLLRLRACVRERGFSLVTQSLQRPG